MVKVTDLRKSYDSSAGRVEVLRGVSLQLARGETVALMGPSGCGKSTLLNIMGCLDVADSGSVKIGEQELVGLDEKSMTELRRKTVGFVFQFFHLLPTLTVRENVELPALIAGGLSHTAAERAARLLELVGLNKRAGHRPHQLSGGEMQRAAIARALVNKPAVVLADEPTGNLDSHNGEVVLRVLMEVVSEENATMIVVTHSAEVASKMGRVLHMADGHILP